MARVIEAQRLTNSITMREKDGKPVLVSGLHRLAAFEPLGRGTILGRMTHVASDDEARLEEEPENLARHELNALDRCHHLYEWLHLGAKHDGEETPEMFGFAEHVGLLCRSIFKVIVIWRGLLVASRRRMAGTWLADHQVNLRLLSEQAPVTQEKVLEPDIWHGGARTLGGEYVGGVDTH